MSDTAAFLAAMDRIAPTSANGWTDPAILATDDAVWLVGTPMDPEAVAADPLPPVAGFPYLHPGNAAVVSGPTGGGRSSLFQACAYDAARAGLRVAYLGSEVTEPEFSARARDLAERRGDEVDDALRDQLALVRYLNLASTIVEAWGHPGRWVDAVVERYDVVGIDPLSAVASSLDLNFDQSNAEFVHFYDRLIRPVTTAGVAVVLLDNVGHALESQGRAKGVSAKGDCADLTFSCKLQAGPVGLVITTRKVRTVRSAFQRGDQWVFLRDTQTIERRERDERDTPGRFRPTGKMERVSRAIEQDPGVTIRTIRTAVGGKVGYVDLAIQVLIDEGYIEARPDGQSHRHYSLKAFREDHDDPTVTHRDPTVTHRDPGHGWDTVTPVSLPLSRDTVGHGPIAHDDGDLGGDSV